MVLYTSQQPRQVCLILAISFGLFLMKCVAKEHKCNQFSTVIIKLDML